MRLLVKQEVYDDLIIAVKWYENQSANLGIRFLNEWEKSLTYIANEPYSYQVIYKKYRQAKITSFPYLMIFEVEAAEIIVYAVIHGRRNPKIRFLRRK